MVALQGAAGSRPRLGHRARLCVVLGFLGVVVALLAGCGGRSGPTTVTPTASSAPSAGNLPINAAEPCGRDTTPPGRYEHVLILMEENRTWTGGRTPAVGQGFSAETMPFLHRLAATCGYYPEWNETTASQSSLSQYVGITSGVANPATVDGCDPSATCRSTDNNIFRQVRSAGGTPRTYVDGATETCSAEGNVPRHIPALYYYGEGDHQYCREEVLPLNALDPDHLPTFAFVVPDLCHDGHDCDNRTVDGWAQSILTPILDGATYRQGSTLVVVLYDEDAPVPNILIAPTSRSGAITSVAGSHASLLKTIELALGLDVLTQGQLPAAIDLRPSAHL